LRLCQLDDVDDSGHMLAAGDLGSLLVNAHQRRIIPSAHDVEVEAIPPSGSPPEALQQCRDVALGDLVLVGHGDTVAVVPDRDDRRGAQHADSVDRFPEHPLGTGCVPDGAPGDLFAVVGERRHVAQLGELAVQARGVGEPDQPGHLRARRRDIRGDIDLRRLHPPRAIGIDQAHAEVAVHLASSGGGLCLLVGMGIELREELLQRQQAQRHQEGLVAVVPRTPVPWAEGFRHGNLGDLLAIAEDAEFGFAGEDLAASQKAGVAAFPADAVVAQHRFPIDPRWKRLLTVGNDNSVAFPVLPLPGAGCGVQKYKKPWRRLDKAA
jgi:hypothetical protein